MLIFSISNLLTRILMITFAWFKEKGKVTSAKFIYNSVLGSILVVFLTG
jgi:hypothetical protein